MKKAAGSQTYNGEVEWWGWGVQGKSGGEVQRKKIDEREA